ncbi:hypothetical protein Taro_018234 [Colocasia esculenta]|uniref:Uncharacterized protein n=1 Tax=Colocasia esculenta TaxID=4460 RepID=A0A843UVN7_COLES|nr:hypothetical protein [Colocasia esculenta]
MVFRYGAGLGGQLRRPELQHVRAGGDPDADPVRSGRYARLKALQIPCRAQAAVCSGGGAVERVGELGFSALFLFLISAIGFCREIEFYCLHFESLFGIREILSNRGSASKWFGCRGGYGDSLGFFFFSGCRAAGDRSRGIAESAQGNQEDLIYWLVLGLSNVREGNGVHKNFEHLHSPDPELSLRDLHIKRNIEIGLDI